jgi:hypothetical protein
MPSEQAEASGAASGQAKGNPSFSSFLLPVLTAIGTGIGILGFVMFFGGFILWTRFKAAGLPANEAVAKVPRSELVATGASFLVPGVLFALGLVALAVAFWDIFIGGPRRRRREQAEGEGEEATEQLADLEEEQQQLEQRKVDATGAEAVEIARRLLELTRQEIPAQRRARREAAEAAKSERLTLSESLLQLLIGIVPLIAVTVYLFLAGNVSHEYVGYVLLAAVLIGAVAVVVVSMTNHFAWYALCIFLGVGVMIAVFNYVRTQTHPKVSPVVALSGPSPVVGYFVAETSEAVYVGRPQPAGPNAKADSMGFDGEKATLIRIPKDSVTDLTVGPLMDADKAYRRSLNLAIALCRRAKAAADGTTAMATETETEAGKKGKGGKEVHKAPEEPVAAKVLPCAPNEEKLLENRLESAPE